MDRRNLWSVGARGAQPSILTGTLAGRPAAGIPGRIYLVSPIITTVTASGGGGTAYPAPTLDTGADWARGESTVWVKRPTASVTGITLTNIARFRLGPNTVIPDHRLSVMVVSRLAQGTATSISYTMRFTLGTTIFIQSAPSNTVALNAVNDTAGIVLVGVSGTLLRQSQSFRTMTNNAPIIFGIGATQVLTNSASQVFNISIELSKNIAGTSYRPVYVEARWS